MRPPAPVTPPGEILRINESVLLSAALVSHVAVECNIRMLLIKGPAATLIGARPVRASLDLDILLERSDVEVLLNALRRRGWEARIREVSEAFPDHSTTLINPGWPSDIDVHWRFPGFYEDESEVFERLWADRQSIELGGRQVWTLSHNDALLVTLLHALRSPAQGVLHDDVSFCLREITASPQRHYDRALELGAMGPLGPLFATMPETRAFDVGEPPFDWVLRTTAQRSATLRLFHLMEIPWSRKPAALWQALVPSRESISWNDLELRNMNQWQQTSFRLRRLRRSLSEGLQTLNEVREIRARIRK
ncbi:nucleotidyltransferase family protein [Arthrobacter sp. ISL-95]|uniref:nucleotidyltransferase family protein n=1 Tax=Arthrobacter sp. ISL-95 TaxID=2819116 RepID=UPI001BEC7CC4|nr:nucleotidyltransferase family protein [Arthrobacter sp. ISL-95]MBT2588222.1 nucleotidyltransferase family protein [Arthrobacter sp. ISL-95]